MRVYIIYILFAAQSCIAIEADILIFGGDIITVNEDLPVAEAVIISDGVIRFVGSLKEAEKFKVVKRMDLQGKTLLPGFVESHTHLLFLGLMQKFVNVSAFQYKTIDEILQVLKKAPQDKAILAFGYDPSLMSDPGDLGFIQLDAISTTVPVLVISQSGHIAYGNKKVFELAQITESSAQVHGTFGKDKEGKLNGKAYELPAIVSLLKGVGDLSLDYLQIAQKTAEQYAQCGFTTVTDLALGLPFPTPLKHIQTLQAVALDPKAPIRIQGYLISPLMDEMDLLKKENNGRFQMLGIKIWADGSTQGYTAALRKKYQDRDTYGLLNYTQEELNALVLKAHEKNFQIAIHANGDQAIVYTLNAYENALKVLPKEDPRFRVEHATVTDHALMKKMKEVKATPSFTNPHVYYYGKVFQEKILGKKRANSIDSARSAKTLGMKFSFNDDAPLMPPNPLLLMEVAVTREMVDGGVLNPDETITIDDAIKAFTIYPAWQSFREKELGSIEVGKYADFVILDKNPKKVKSSEIHSIQVMETWVQGKQVFKK
jgi:predicted amidohydrolase YtcJ